MAATEAAAHPPGRRQPGSPPVDSIRSLKTINFPQLPAYPGRRQRGATAANRSDSRMAGSPQSRAAMTSAANAAQLNPRDAYPVAR